MNLPCGIIAGGKPFVVVIAVPLAAYRCGGLGLVVSGV